MRNTDLTEPSPNGLELFKIESGIKMPGRIHSLEHSADYAKLSELIKTFRVGQSIVIKSEWRNWPARIKKVEKLTISLMVYKIMDNPKYYRVYRTK